MRTQFHPAGLHGGGSRASVLELCGGRDGVSIWGVEVPSPAEDHFEVLPSSVG